MPARPEDVVALRSEILELLRQQTEVLDTPRGLTHDQLRQCYDRQSRVRQLREKLQAIFGEQAATSEMAR
jgi:hypothetical protein